MSKFHFKRYPILLSLLFVGYCLTAQINFNTQSSYRYLKGNQAQNLSGTWMNDGFDDSNWSFSNAPFRYGDGNGGTLLEDMMGNYSSLYLRSTFEVLNLEQLQLITIGVNWDDGFTVWVNGKEVLKSQAPATYNFDAIASGSHESGSLEYFSFSANDLNLREGDNTIAVFACNIDKATSSDFYFDMNIVARIDLSQLSIFDDSLGVNFSHSSGFYDDVFNLELTSELSNVKIAYTTDGSNPQTSITALQGQSPVLVSVNPELTDFRAQTPCFIVRASVIKDGFAASFPESRSFIFLDQVKQQKNPGSTWPSENLSDKNKQYIDYAVDPDVVNSSLYKNQIDDAFKAIPTLSIATGVDNLFDPDSGIYVNAYGQGREWERDCSVELIDPNGNEGFNINAGLRIRGGWSRHDYYPKHALRLFFRDEYGKGKLKYPLFDDEGVDEFDKIDLRTASNYSWVNNSGPTHNTFVREVFTRDSQNAAGQPYTRSRYYHLYLNGMYWGIYQTQERSEARFAESYFGGDSEDYDVVKISGEDYSKEINATDGTLDLWEEIYNLTKKGFVSNERYFHLEGKDKNGNVIPHAEVLVDIDNLIDFMINIIYTGNYDSPVSAFGGNKKPNNFYAITNREDKTFGFKFFVHDGEHVLMTVPSSGPGIGLQENRANIGDRSGDDRMVVNDFSMFHSQWLHYMLSKNVEYRKRFADRAWEQLTGNGIFTPEECEKRLNVRTSQIDKAIIAESARWGDTQSSTPYTRDKHWVPEINVIKNNYFPYRTDIVISQLKKVKLFHNVSAPVIKYGGTEVLENRFPLYAKMEVVLENPSSNGDIYYTTNGDDPRLLGDGIASSAIKGTSNEVVYLKSSTIIKARILNNGTWSAINEVKFVIAQNDYSNLKVTEIHYHPLDSVNGIDTISNKNYEFIEFRNVSQEKSINLTGLTIDSAINFQFPDDYILAPLQYFVVAAKPAKFFDRYGLVASGNYEKNLGNGGERIYVSNPNGDVVFDFTYDDSDPWPKNPDGLGFSLESVSDTPEGDPNASSYWMASHIKHGTPFGHSLIKSTTENFIANDEVIVYPNPVQHELNIDLGDYYNNVKAALYGIDGRIVWNVRFESADFITEDVSHLKSGIYILQIRADGITKNISVVKQ